MRFVVVVCIRSAIWASLRAVILVFNAQQPGGGLVCVSRPTEFSVWEQRTINHPNRNHPDVRPTPGSSPPPIKFKKKLTFMYNN